MNSRPKSAPAAAVEGAPLAGDVLADGDPAAAAIPNATRNVVALGAVSLLTDISSEMIIPLLPAFVTGTLRASVASLGVIEGVAECTATVLRLASGWLSDRIGARKPFMLSGYGISTVAKGALALTTTWTALLGLRFADRLGKGLRNPPRDALIADSVPRARLGRAFGLHRAMDTAGAALGPLAAFLLLQRWPGQVRRVFLASLVPATLSMVVLALFVVAPRVAGRRGVGTLRHELGSMDPLILRFMIVAGVFSLGASSMAFVLLRAGQAGFNIAQVPLVYMLYNVVYAVLAWPVGHLSDRIGRRPLLVAAYLSFALCYGLLAWKAERTVVLLALLMLGLHSALFEGTQRSALADLVPPERRGTAYGVYYTVVGLALLPASAGAGWLWDHGGPRLMFGLDAALALGAALLFVVLLPAHRERLA